MISIEFVNGDILSGEKFQGIGNSSGIYQISDIYAFFDNIDKIKYIRLNPLDGELYHNKKETWWYEISKMVRIIDSKNEHRNVKIDIINED